MCSGRRPGCRPGGRVSFFRVAERKSPKKGRPCCLRPLRCATGQPGVLGHGVHRRTRCAPVALRSDNCGESVHEVRVSFGTRTHPLPCASRHAQKGTLGIGHPYRPSLRSAPSRGRKRHALRKLGRAKQWPEWMSAPRVPFRMRRGAQRPADQGSRLSERSETQRVRARPRWTRAPQVARSEAKGRSV